MCPDAFTETAAVVMDNGTGYTKAGFAGDDKPRVVVRSLVGIPNQGCDEPGKGPDYYVGSAIPGDPWVLRAPVVTNGIVTDWDALEMLWHHIFYQELRVAPEEHAVLLSDAPLSPTTNREKAAELLFEGFAVPAMYVAHQSLLSLYSTGRTTGLIIESGLGVSYTAPIHNGYTMPHATFRLDLAGGGLTEYMAKLLEECGNPFSAEEMHPDAVGLTDPGLHALAWRSLDKCGAERRAELLGNIVLSGGSSMFPGFAERVQREMGALAPGRAKLNVYASPQRKFSVWIGGSITACLNTFQSMWVSRRDYDDKGPVVVHRKCF
ncbi:actin, acrosomal process isoform-like isoform X3 [Stegostoma tigrinum]|uniref:actin, acrosomal process isoform-like isoform X3 n=1 Tax=Stegostoma tigrinum TaxID=3053191 RepID=UPI002870902A|nr:actin, acrosomal process isoform-like isoform X3 [Stegostoma tigrinum]